MNDKLFRTMLSLWMCSDPWPLTAEEQAVLISELDAEAKRRGYDGYLEAYHEMPGFAK